MKLKPINRVCPNCGSGNYMRFIDGKNVGKLNVKCINCNSYFNYDDLSNKEQKGCEKMNIYIKSCPFCGGVAKVIMKAGNYSGSPITIRNRYVVGCENCHIFTSEFESKIWLDEKGDLHIEKNGAEEAVKLWNRRANDDWPGFA